MPPSLAVELPLTEPAGVFLVLFVVVLVMPRLADELRLPGLVGLTVGGIMVGPYGLGLLDRTGLIAVLGGAGLLFLMFEAGLELDRDVLHDERRRTVVFGVLTFAFPFVFGTAIHFALGYSVAAALLLASCWSSHTLLSYPLFQRSRVTANRAVTVALGGTVITDTAALIFLAALARVEQGNFGWQFAASTAPLIVAAAAAIMWGLPRFAAWFFASIGQERSARFLFVMVALFGAAALAELAGVEPIIGAFLAGLALSRLVVRGSALEAQVRFFGSNLLTPVFMISVGMLIDPSVVVSDTETLTRAAGFTVAVVGGKAAAAAVSGYWFHWRRSEIAALFSLSVGQAAATLAAVFVGFEIGLLDESTVNAAILVILTTSVIASLTGKTVVTRLPPPPAKVDRLGQRVLLPVSGLSRAEVQIGLAAAVALADSGTVLPVTVLGYNSTPALLRGRRADLVDTVERSVLKHGSEATSSVRLDSSRAAGILHAAVEQDATCMVIGWKGWSNLRESFFGESVDSVLATSAVPVLVVRPPTNQALPRHVLIALDDIDARLDHRSAVEVAVASATRIASSMKLPLVVCRASDASPHDADIVAVTIEVASSGRLTTLVAEIATDGDIVVMPLPATKTGFGSRFVRQIRGLDALTVVATCPARTDLQSPVH
jgi:Kef-type K+ transport system membrane component KefB/nucleotide-binding universal stress UspA family protein